MKAWIRISHLCTCFCANTLLDTSYSQNRLVCSFVRWFVRPSVRRKVPHLTRTISRQRKELPEIRWCQNDQIFEGLSGVQKKVSGICLQIFVFTGYLHGSHLLSTRRVQGTKSSRSLGPKVGPRKIGASKIGGGARSRRQSPSATKEKIISETSCTLFEITKYLLT